MCVGSSTDLLTAGAAELRFCIFSIQLGPRDLSVRSQDEHPLPYPGEGAFTPVWSPGCWPNVHGLSLDAASVEERWSPPLSWLQSCQQKTKIHFSGGGVALAGGGHPPGELPWHAALHRKTAC